MIGSVPGIHYSASLFNVSAMSFGALSAPAILSLNEGAKRGNFYHNTGEGGVSQYHLENGGDIVWNIGTGYFSCRNKKTGAFDPELYRKVSSHPHIKMTEIKLSQGAKPGE
jgi:glutamate synthase domain-containing protein 2